MVNKNEKVDAMSNRSHAFVLFILKQIKNDKGVAAALRRADNPATEHQSWEELARFGVELDKSYIRLPFATIAAALAKAKVDHNGNIGVGSALAGCYSDGCESDQAKAKLRRLLACSSAEELCRILRPLFSLMFSKCNPNLDFSRLLNEMLMFNKKSQQIKARWAEDFYKYKIKNQDKKHVC
jgi:CRISPR system Cascade subunit CasB